MARPGRWLRPAIVALAGEALLVTANRGDCPLGWLGERIGDEVPLFELVLPPRGARIAVPALGVVAAGGVVVLRVRLACSKLPPAARQTRDVASV